MYKLANGATYLQEREEMVLWWMNNILKYWPETLTPYIELNSKRNVHLNAKHLAHDIGESLNLWDLGLNKEFLDIIP